MKNIKKFHVLHVFLIFMLITSSVLGVFVSAKTFIFNSKTTESAIKDELVPTLPDGEGGGVAATTGGSKTTASGYNLNSEKIVNKSSDGIYDIPDDIYKNNTDFIITDFLGLKKFAGIVNSNDNNHLGWDGFKGKTIYLNSDIDCGGKSICIGFIDSLGYCRYIDQAVFDGQNHTISNFTLSYSSNDAYYGETTALFQYIGGSCKIRNLKVKNIIVPDTSANYVGFAGLVGKVLGNNSAITNCVVEGFIAENPSKAHLTAGIVNWFGPQQDPFATKETFTLENCVSDVRGINIELSWADSGIISGYGRFAFDPVGLVTMKNCIMIGFHTEADVTIAPSLDENEVINCKKLPNDTIGLSCSSIGGNTKSQSTTWYYAADYNDGFPCLRQFVEKWKYVYFKTANGASVSPSSILIPIDANGTYPDPGKNIIKVYNRDITATRPNSMCEHAKASWSRKEETISGVKINTYTCTFTANTRTIKFLGSQNTSITSTESFTIICGSLLEYSYETYTGTTDKFKSVTYTFTTTNGDEKQVTYSTVGISHYISDVSIKRTAETHNNLIISVETKLKSYNVQIE